MPRLLAFLLLLLTPLQAMGQALAVVKPDAVSTRLIDAKEAFVQEMQSADRDLLDAINEALSDATSEGNFDRAMRVTATKEAFEKDFLLPTDGSLGTARSNYHRRFVDARQAVEGVFDELVVELTRAGDLKRGDSLRAEKERWLGLVAKRKTTRTRYQHPVPPDAVRWEKNGHYYKVFKESLSWHGAKKQCEEMGGHLVIIDDENEQDAVVNLLVQSGIPVDNTGGRNWDGVWLGATREADGGKWLWIDGSPLRFTRWETRQPDGSGKYLKLCIHHGGRWDDQPVGGYRTSLSFFMCEWDE